MWNANGVRPDRMDRHKLAVTVLTRKLRPIARPASRKKGKLRIISKIPARSEEHTSELQSLMRISYAVFCLKKKTKNTQQTYITKTMLTQPNSKNTRTRNKTY